jgi:hypothetical protein
MIKTIRSWFAVRQERALYTKWYSQIRGNDNAKELGAGALLHLRNSPVESQCKKMPQQDARLLRNAYAVALWWTVGHEVAELTDLETAKYVARGFRESLKLWPQFDERLFDSMADHAEQALSDMWESFTEFGPNPAFHIFLLPASARIPLSQKHLPDTRTIMAVAYHLGGFKRQVLDIITVK